jgi:5,10-methylenetetrahydrofolate reductase
MPVANTHVGTIHTVHDLLGAAALGIRNLLILTGDDPSAGFGRYD